MSDENEYPAVCERCIGTDAQVKMLKQANGAECKTCTRPFTVFMWKPSISVKKYSKTIICITCARARNCCQSCMLDITYGIPLDVRDAALKMAGVSSGYLQGSNGTKNTEVKAIMADKLQAQFNAQDSTESNSDEAERARDILNKLSQRLNESSPKFLKSSSASLPKKSSSGSAADMKKIDISGILSKLPFSGVIGPAPSDETVTSFFIFGINDDVPQYVINDYCNKFGKIKSLTIVHRAKAGYVTFISRSSAEAFANEIDNNGHNKNKKTAGILILEGKYPVRVSWGKPKPLGTTKEEHSKLSLVVNKVLKQLAEKDAAVKNSGRAKLSSSQSTQDLSKKTTSNNKTTKPKANAQKQKGNSGKVKKPETYKTLSEDFEL